MEIQREIARDPHQRFPGGPLRARRAGFIGLAVLAWTSAAIAVSDPVEGLPRAIIQAPPPVEAPAARGAADVQFDPGMMLLPGIDLSKYTRSGYVTPGVYRVDVVVNGRLVGHDDIRFINPGGGRPKPCLDDSQLERFGIDRQRVPSVYQPVVNSLNGADASQVDVPLPEDQRSELLQCGDVFSSIRFADAWLNHGSLTLRLTVPQAALTVAQQPAQNVPLNLLDDGVDAGILSYNFSDYASPSTTSEYLQLNGRLNTGPFRTYWNGNASHATGSGLRLSNSNMYTDRPVNDLSGRLSMGEIQSSGEVLASVPLFGARLYSEQGVLTPYNGTSSTVQGIARTQAHVVLRQQGNIVYETNVPPGPFALNDFTAPAPVDISVEVQESDGTVETFVVPYIRPAQLLKPGEWRYDAAAGVAHLTGLGGLRNPAEVQGLMYYGLSPSTTVYGGAQLAFGGALPALYSAGDIGATFATRYGTWTGDLSASHVDLVQGGSVGGFSLRLSYQYNLQATGTQFGLAAYRYSDRNYLSLPQAVALNAASLERSAASPFSTIGSGERQEFDLMASQPLFGGTLSARMMLSQYWSNPQLPLVATADGSTFLLGYTRRIGEGDLSYSIERDTGPTGLINRQTLQYSLPLGSRQAGAQRPILNNMVTEQNGNVTVSQGTGLNERFHDQPYSVGLQYGYNPANIGQGNLGLSVGTSFNAMSLNAGVNVGPTGSTYSLSGMGALLAHPGGVELVNSAPDTIALVHVDGGAGAHVGGGSEIDANGYGVTFLSPLKDNVVEVNPSGALDDLELQTTRKHAAPSRGAVVAIDFAAVPGRSVHIDAQSADGKPLPFGASVTDSKGTQIGMVGQGGGIFARVPTAQGRLRVVWGADDDLACDLNYQFVPAEMNKTTRDGLPTTAATCVVTTLAKEPSPGPSLSQANGNPIQR